MAKAPLLPTMAKAVVQKASKFFTAVKKDTVVKKAKKASALVPKKASALVPKKATALVPKKATALVAKKAAALVAMKAKQPEEAKKGPRAPSVPTCITVPGEKLNVGRFYAIAQCSLRMEAKELMGKDFPLTCPEAQKLWPDFERMAKRNLGSNEKWVPFHTVLGVHEFFLVEKVHHAKVSWWKDYHRFVAMFIFRSHCKCDLFEEVQMPFLAKQEFWKDLPGGFKENSAMEKAIAKFRASGRPLQTSCFLIIPERILPDDNANLVRNVCLRTQRLCLLAHDLWGVVNEKKTSSEEKFNIIKDKILETRNLGDTWVKMLTVVIDLAYPRLKMLQDRCEVGVGAADPMRKILEDEGLLSPKVVRVVERRVGGVPEGYCCTQSLKQGIVAVKLGSKQLIQVTKGMAGSLDRADFIAEKLAALANKGVTDQEKLKVHRDRMFADKSLRHPKLGLDAKAEEMIKRDLELGPNKSNPDEPTPSEALQQLRARINQSDIPSAAHFWRLLGQVETHARKHYARFPIVVSQMSTAKGRLSAVTLQVQLCEVRQFDNFVAAKGASAAKALAKEPARPKRKASEALDN